MTGHFEESAAGYTVEVSSSVVAILSLLFSPFCTKFMNEVLETFHSFCTWHTVEVLSLASLAI